MLIAFSSKSGVIMILELNTGNQCIISIFTVAVDALIPYYVLYFVIVANWRNITTDGLQFMQIKVRMTRMMMNYRKRRKSCGTNVVRFNSNHTPYSHYANFNCAIDPLL